METALMGQVINALRKNPYLDFSSLSYETKEGRVVLRGKVQSFFGKQMAQESIRRIKGIYEILNELEVLGRTIRVDQ